MPHKGFAIAGSRIALGLMAAVALISLTSCGGNSSVGSGPTGTVINVSFTGYTMPSAIAYQVGTTGTFKSISVFGSSASFTLPSGTDAYGFAYICPTFSDPFSFSNESTIQATTADTTSLSLECPYLPGVVNATYDASAIPGATSVIMYVGYRSDQTYQTSGSVGLYGIPIGTYDVALVASNQKIDTLAIQILRGVSITRSTTIAFPPMTAADEVGTSAPVSITRVPSGATYSGFGTNYNTSGGLSINLPGPFHGDPNTTYPTVPPSQSQPGDFYLIEAGAGIQPVGGVATQNFRAELSSNTPTAVTVALPSPLSSVTAPTAAAFPTFNANTSGFTVAGTVVNSSSVQYYTAPGIPSTVYNVYTYVTQSWLGANTTFTVPNLSTLAGFAPAPRSGGQEDWILYSTAGTPLQLQNTPEEQSVVIAPTSPMSVQYITTSGNFTTP